MDMEYLVKTLSLLVAAPSPTGRAQPALAVVEAELQALGLTVAYTPKGALLTNLDGLHPEPLRAVTSHVDTLGALVKHIKPNGRITPSSIGGFAWQSVEGESCTVFTRAGKTVRGTLLPVKASVHVHGDEVGSGERLSADMEVRLDAASDSDREASSLGIEVGDYIAFDPRLEISDSGYIRSRHLDDKAGVACVLTAIRELAAAGVKPECSVVFHFSNYEEVGHGAAGGLPPGVAELIVVDMAPVGEGQASRETVCTLCIADRRGPYDHGLTGRLSALARQNGIAVATDVYPYYGSDGGAYWFAGGQAPVALLGPGVDASHHVERTHRAALEATTALLIAYLRSS